MYVHYKNRLILLGKVTNKESEGTRKQADTLSANTECLKFG